ncbi:MAG: 8-amino-7-oxononanoate synthase [Robiginitomaculum sp.]
MKNNSAEKKLLSVLKRRKKTNNLRQITVVNGIDFCSNDYLGLTQLSLSPNRVASGSTGSRLISGHSDAIAKLEKDIAAFHGYEAALLFSSGYAANFGLLACIADARDAILSDTLIHASLIDGIRLSYAHKERFPHNDMHALETKLEKLSSQINGQIYVVVESIYSMDGNEAPLQAICELCQKYGAALIVDEAHAIGVYGHEGRGLVSSLHLEAQVFACVFTFGKAVGMHGAAILGSAVLYDYLVNFCRSFIFTTAPSPQTVQDTKIAYTRFKTAHEARNLLTTALTSFEEIVKTQIWDNTYWLPSTSPIQGLVIPGNTRAKALASHLLSDGYAVKAILSPTVPKGEERLRISLHSFNTRNDIEDLAGSLGRFFDKEIFDKETL